MRWFFAVRPRGRAGLSGLTAFPARLNEDPVVGRQAQGWDLPADARAERFPQSASVVWIESV
jgi:hypothetical protein